MFLTKFPKKYRGPMLARAFTRTPEQVLKNYKLTTGFEIHCQMLTETKLFSNAPTKSNDLSNSCASFVDVALPGMLPVLNKECLKVALKASLALKGDINKKDGYEIRFDRKHYFYPDMPQGYQITQKEHPIMENGYLRFYNRLKKEDKIGIERIQIEQDSAKSFHDFHNYSGIDYNRAGSALLEIVTFPEIHHPIDARIVVRELQETLKYLNISTANMEEGQMRCDVNISLRHRFDSEKFGNRVELKNLQGIKFIEKAIESEIVRQATIIDSGGYVPLQTRRYDVDKNETILLREKEDDLDYRFMYDPDLPSYFITPEMISEAEEQISSVPFDEKKKLSDKFGLTVDQAQTVFSYPELYDYFMETLIQLNEIVDPQLVYNYIFSIFIGNCTKKNLTNFKFKIDQCKTKGNDRLIELMLLQVEDKISFSHAKMVLYEIIDGDKRSSFNIAKDSGFIKNENTSIEDINAVIDKILEEKQDIVEKLRAENRSNKRKKKLGPIMFLVGQAMRVLKADGDPQYVQEYIRKKVLGK
ncbi:unnamed protein product [Moneuplotes crassus]|uniref:Glutamyl-tRNA(Gln) amidotransferase subunit B, mitochondrial n=1 Tax=Euplotes crassus TaxID=5936 RepID=A0AAD1U0I3_EUPCR|nr:unnamed protein product [Moneuplotes crassus]